MTIAPRYIGSGERTEKVASVHSQLLYNRDNDNALSFGELKMGRCERKEMQPDLLSRDEDKCEAFSENGVELVIDLVECAQQLQCIVARLIRK